MAKRVYNHVACVNLDGARRAEDGKPGFQAQYISRCGVCGLAINPGDRITAGGRPVTNTTQKDDMNTVEMNIAGEKLTVTGDKAPEFGQAIVDPVQKQGGQAHMVHVAEPVPVLPPVAVAPAKTDDVTTAAGLLAQALAAAVAASPELEARIAKLEARAPVTNTIVLHAVTDTRVDVGATHQAFEKTLRWVNRRRHIWMAGPTGSGKTTLAEQVAKALGLKFYYSGALWDAYGLSGFKNAHGEYVRTLFREAYEHGGVFLLDEVDACEPAALLWLNGALANGLCPFPDAMVPKHKDFVCICAANTWGNGATNEYVGRMKQDNAFLDRFIAIAVDYDAKLERALCANDAWFERIQVIRSKIKAKGLRVIVSPRATLAGAQALADGQAWGEVEQEVLASKMTPDQWNSVK